MPTPGVLLVLSSFGLSGLAAQPGPARPDVDTGSVDLGDPDDPCSEHEDCPPGQRCLDDGCRADPRCVPQQVQPCSWSLGGDDCAAAGGWTRCADPESCTCICPSTRAGCACWKAEHCDGECLVPGDCQPGRLLGTCSPGVQLDYGQYCVPNGIDSYGVLAQD